MVFYLCVLPLPHLLSLFCLALFYLCLCSTSVPLVYLCVLPCTFYQWLCVGLLPPLCLYHTCVLPLFYLCVLPLFYLFYSVLPLCSTSGFCLVYLCVLPLLWLPLHVFCLCCSPLPPRPAACLCRIL